MHRSMMQVFVKESHKAFEFYQRAFDAQVVCRHSNADGTLAHAELDIYGQILAISELADAQPVTGNTMMFCLHFGDGQEAAVQKIFNVLKDGAEMVAPLGACDYSPLQAALIDKFGVSWCIFV